MTTGIIKTIRDDKGYGFIAPDDAASRNDVFFHQSAVTGAAFADLEFGQRVQFDVEPDPRDPSRQRAVNVTPVED